MCVIAFYLISSSPVQADNTVITYDADGTVAIPQGVFSDADGNRLSVTSNASSTLQFDGEIAEIGNYAFHNCQGLTSITLPNSVSSIGYFAFSNCEVLTTSVYNSTLFARLPVGTSDSYQIPEGTKVITSGAFVNCSSLPAVMIPDGVAVIEESAFNHCSSLRAITLPSSITSIGDFAFGGCALSSILAEGATPAAICKGTFGDVDKRNCTLYVPSGSKEAYQSASYWSEFKKVEEVDPAIFALSDVFYTSLVEGRIGGTKSISIRLKNSAAFRGFSFQMQLPEGVNIVDYTFNENRLPAGIALSDATLNAAIAENTFTMNCTLPNGNTFTGFDDEIVKVTLSFDENMTEGDYQICFSDGAISPILLSANLISDVNCALTLEDYVIGDVDGDGHIGIRDVISVLNYIVNNQSVDGFNYKAADANEDGQLRISDVMIILKTIVNQ